MELNYSTLETYLEKVRAIMRPFQVKCTTHLIQHKRVILAVRGGAGKTLMALTASFAQHPRKILIVCSRNALYTWEKEIKKWYPEYISPGTYNVVKGEIPKAKRSRLWARDAVYYVCTYKTLIADINTGAFKKHSFDVLIADEYHRGGLRNYKTLGYKIFKTLCDIPVIYLMTGSSIRKGPQNYWAVLNILDSKLFPSYWRFVNTYCDMHKGPFGQEYIGPKNQEGFAQATYKNLYRIPKEITDAELPKVTRQIIPIEMTPRQRKAYQQLATDMYVVLDQGAINVASTLMAQYTKFRQLLVCPRILGVDDLGTGVLMIDDFLADREDIRTVIFTPFRPAVTIFKEYFQAKHPTINVQSLWGGDTPETIKEVTESFRASGGIVIVSINFAESFELESADNCHFLGYDWDQNVNWQCEWRLQRLTSDVNRPITAYYYQYRNSIDEEVLEVLDTNTRNVVSTFKEADKLKMSLYRTINPQLEEDKQDVVFTA